MPAIARICNATVTLLAALLLLAASARARVLVPPGNSGASQYVEVVPSAEGSVTPGTQGHNHARVLAPSTEHSLKSLGSEGKAMASFAQATGTPHGSSATTTHNGRTGPADSHRSRAVSPPTSGQIVKTAAEVSNGSLGWGLPLALGLAVLAAVAVLMLRRRSSASGSSDSD